MQYMYRRYYDANKHHMQLFCLFPTHKGVLSWLDASEPSIVLLHLPADDFHGIISATAIGINVVSGI